MILYNYESVLMQNVGIIKWEIKYLSLSTIRIDR